MLELRVARQKQAEDKAREEAQMAKMERDEFVKVIRKQKEDIENERKVEESKKADRHANQWELRKQMQTNSEKGEQSKRDYLEEGRMLRQTQAEERKNIEKIKHEKLGHIQGLGIPGKYQAELAKKKVT